MTGLQKARIGMGMSREGLAKWLGVEKEDVEAMERGELSLTREAEAFIEDAIDDGLSAYDFDIEGENQ